MPATDIGVPVVRVRRTDHQHGAPRHDHFLAVAVVMIGLASAVYAIPDDVEPRGALQAPAWLLAGSLVLVPMLSVVRNMKAMFRAEHLLFIAPVYWILLDLLQGRYALVGVGHEAVAMAFLAIVTFVGGASIAFLHPPWRMPQFVKSTASTELPTQFYFSVGLLAFALTLLKYAIPAHFDLTTILQSLTTSRWDAPWMRGRIGGSEAFVDHLSYFGYLLPPITAILGRRLGWTDARTLVLGALSLVIAAFMIHDGGRRLVGMLAGSGLMLWFLGAPRIRFSTVVVLALLLLGLWFTLERMLMFRTRGVIASFIDSDVKPDPAIADTALVSVDDNFLRLVQTVAIFPEQHPYTTWRYVLWIAVRPVPRALWPGKPVDPGFDLAEFVRVRGASLSSSVVGELYMAGGLIGVIMGGWLYGRLASMISRFLYETRTAGGALIYSIAFFSLFLGFRSMLELVLMNYVVLGWVGLVHLQTGFRGLSQQRVRPIASLHRWQ